MQVAGEGKDFVGGVGAEAVEAGEEGGEVVDLGLQFALGVVQGEGELLPHGGGDAQQAVGGGEGVAVAGKDGADAAHVSGFSCPCQLVPFRLRQLTSLRLHQLTIFSPCQLLSSSYLPCGGAAGEGGGDVGQ